MLLYAEMPATRPKTRPRRAVSRRTTLTFPHDLLKHAETAAQKKHQSLSSLVSGFLADGLRNDSQAAERTSQILDLWKAAFVPRNEEERWWLEGVVLEPRKPRHG